MDWDELMFECPVCTEQFDDTCKMLPCQHVFCIKCLEQIYDKDERLNCPTCRMTVSIPILDLQRPILLLTLLEKFKAKVRSTDDLETNSSENEFSTAIGMSIESFNDEKRLEASFNEQENLQLKIALSKSAEDVVLEERRRMLEIEKENLELKVALINSSEFCTSTCESATTSGSETAENVISNVDGHDFNHKSDECSAKFNEDADHLCDLLEDLHMNLNSEKLFSADCHSLNDTNANQPVASGLNDLSGIKSIPCCSRSGSEISVYEDCAAQLEEYADKDACSTVPEFPLDILELKKYGASGNEQVLLTIMKISADEKLLNRLNMTQLNAFINRIDEYRGAIELYRSDLMKNIIEECGSGDTGAGKLDWMISVSTDDDETEEYLNDEDRDLAYALELSRQAYFESNEDTALQITLKKSEKIDPLDDWILHLNLVKERLELVKVVLLSENDN